MNLIDLYTTVQGEGPNVGKRTTFVRFGGCNMRCPGWPCDTPYSIEPTIWRKEAEKVEPDEIVKRCLNLGPKHVCITGGEPLLQKTDDINALFVMLMGKGFTVDLFTNGSRDFSKYFVHYNNVTIVMDWKLRGSGEGDSFKKERISNLHFLTEKDAVKFVVKDMQDLHEAKFLIREWMDLPFRKYISPAFDHIEPAEIVAFMEKFELEDAWLNVQMHKLIWEPTERRI